MKHTRHPSIAALVAVLAVAAASTHAQERQESSPVLVHAKLFSESASLRKGANAWLAIQLTMQPGWHTYWRNPGDSGLATSIAWTLPKGVSAGPIVWPIPEQFVSNTLAGYGYAGETTLLTALSVPRDFPFDNVAIGAKVSWLACAKTCIPGAQTLTIALPVTDEAAQRDARNTKLFAQARRRLPQPGSFKSSFDVDAENIVLHLPASAAAGAHPALVFYPFDSRLIEHAAPQAVERRPGGWDLKLRRSPTAPQTLRSIDGLLIMGDSHKRGARAVEISVTGNSPREGRR